MRAWQAGGSIAESNETGGKVGRRDGGNSAQYSAF